MMEISLNGIKKSLASFLFRFHALLFVTLALGGLIIAVFFLNQVILSSDQPDNYATTTTDQSFDTATITQLKTLYSSTEGEKPAPLDLSTGRVDPF